MNDETHDSGSDRPDDVDHVLRPFEAHEPPPLPPITPSAVVPEPEPEPEPEPQPEPEPEPQASVPPPPPVEALEDDPWTDETVGAENADEPVPDGAEDQADDHPEAHEIDAEPAGPDEPTSADTVTIPRKPFFVGVALLLGAVVVLAALLQRGDDPETATVDDTPAVEDDATGDDDESDAEDVPDVADTPNDAAAARIADELADTEADLQASHDDLAAAEAEVASLTTRVEQLEERPPPALPGSWMRRIVVGADAKYLSTLADSVSVVGAFGGVSMIDPDTNRVVANANVADAGTRILRTGSSVWITNYADQLLLRIDPRTNELAAAFPFAGPDGIEKDDDTLIVASFDGGYVARVNPGDGTVIQQVDVGGTPTEVFVHPDHGIWAAVFDTGEIVQIDGDTFEILQRVVVGQGPVDISAGPIALWVTNHDEGTVAKVDPVAGEVLFTASVGDGPTEAVPIGGSVFITVTGDGNLVEISTGDGTIRTVTPLGGATAGGGPTGIAATGKTLWVAMQGEQSVVRIDLE